MRPICSSRRSPRPILKAPPDISALIRRGLLKSDTPQGKVRFALPLHALRFYFPALWSKVEDDAGE
jgi:hypothetical protein